MMSLSTGFVLSILHSLIISEMHSLATKDSIPWFTERHLFTPFLDFLQRIITLNNVIQKIMKNIFNNDNSTKNENYY